ncbi:cryptochrome/photolyase family protein [Ferrimonas balearica]|uniref:cryptochrome/photolyase family protein n=1 Tax=Ferrimonas balearica TaxID=44012 RepID=UPI001C99350D|nr:cryptochrome/photolyase family protein [Ferrimonas balearica]MBY5920287.1 cryptochrome/photolyase family protein [Ferrimonas balearica]MBY5997028.1 cryptochrome/photolyase family protein [Ferrimonas balearica]
MIHTLRLILGDQLNPNHSWFRQRDDGVLYLIAELKQETGYVRHHIQKLCAFFAAMAAFASELQQAGHRVRHLTLDDTAAYPDLPALIRAVFEESGATRFEFQRPDEYRLLKQLTSLDLPIAAQQVDTEHFLLPFEEIDTHFQRNKAHRMETFYRTMRKRFALLMEGDKPLGGQWNYDKENRHALKPIDWATIPAPLCFGNDVMAIRARLDRHQTDSIGRLEGALIWPINRTQSLELLSHFCHYALPGFGRFQDALSEGAPHNWSLFHARLSFSLNTKMLHPMEVIQAAINAYQHNEAITLPQVEGFVRQILGWREYVRGIYWANMPGYETRNHFKATRPLPSWFWTGETRMACLRQAITHSLDYAYAHHIQRLMITGTFALMIGADPDEVDAWYLGIYIDAIEWVELPNTRGMSQFADGGLLASKPYAASGNYVNKMSDHCQSCAYNVAAKTGEDACPLNSLYWHFMARHDRELARNPRIAVVYRGWDNRPEAERQAILARAEWCLENLDAL